MLMNGILFSGGVADGSCLAVHERKTSLIIIRGRKRQKRSRNCAKKIFAESHMLKIGWPSCLDGFIDSLNFTKFL